jgi:hypothetical protein
MKNVYQSTHIATSPKTKQQLRKFKEEFSEEISWDKERRNYRK